MNASRSLIAASDEVLAGRDEQSVVGAVVAAADPHRFVSPASGNLRARLGEQRRVHRQDRFSVDVFRKRDSCGHRPLVGDDQRGVAACVGVKLGFRDGAGGRCQVLDLG